MDLLLSVATSPNPNNDMRRDLTPGIRVVVVLGSTATGKTALAISLAEAFEGEVINADSRYLYRGMDIGTAKPSEQERSSIPHHLIDIRDPHEPYSLGTFLSDAYGVIEDVAKRGRLPIVAGGTPQYLRAMIEGWTVPEVEPDWALREALEQEAAPTLFERLQNIDPVTAARADPANKRRLIRAIEVYERTGRPMSEVAGQSPPPYRFFIVGLQQDRAILYSRIDRRVREMYAAGWLDEVQRLRERG
ncbi:MAG: tRNA (adenosine(37)-N6)-dimethylallyltransferase MiaA, partial [Chloroflexota bacterium]|nr:tRNA (adenosine(37)-N6)-dimethylallyltransferase MiaA [Chloroflexota bacterium]